MTGARDSYFDELERFYTVTDIAVWQRVLGPQLHYHNGFFPEGDETLEEATCLAVRSLYDDVQPGASLLDAGCGWGGPLAMLVEEHGCRGQGITISQSQRDYCTNLGLSVHRANLESFVPEGRFDACLLLESLEHIRDKRRLFRVLSGHCDTLLLRTNCTARVDRAFHPHTVPPGYMFLETPGMILGHLEATGWRVERSEDRRPLAVMSNKHWLERLQSEFPMQEPPGHLGVLYRQVSHAEKNPEAWAAANPLLEVVASRR
ncbi:MAG: class I SAM-dependent methyltransferase [Xanthomonadales bacterium]|jgi:cyclopropane-fatty-acyl-phospholipid synthase|nr:class I SAM-dependent methyltransferase [Xanthomonadales bacterium]